MAAAAGTNPRQGLGQGQGQGLGQGLGQGQRQRQRYRSEGSGWIPPIPPHRADGRRERGVSAGARKTRDRAREGRRGTHLRPVAGKCYWVNSYIRSLSNTLLNTSSDAPSHMHMCPLLPNPTCLTLGGRARALLQLDWSAMGPPRPAAGDGTLGVQLQSHR